ncbi:MAG: hypothetical protein ABUL73_06620 [Alphaproteobacteria bacterium]
MRVFAVLTALGFVLAAAPAVAKTMDSTFGNTVTVTHPDGAVERYFFEPDGSFTARMPGGQNVVGQWVRRDAEVCLTVQGQDENCTPVADDKNVGDSWTLETGGGSLVIAIVRGRS